jgi:hypothetical protein
MPRESSQITTARREYEQCKRLYHKVGKKAAGKPARSQSQRDYVTVRAEYHRLGKRLGQLTLRGATRERMYHLVAINERTGKKTRLTSSPMGHQRAVTNKSKFNPRKDVRIQLEPVKS